MAKVLTFRPVPGAHSFGEPPPPLDYMRVMTSRVCRGCGHKWIQPSVQGDCPKCGSAKTASVKQRVCGAERV